MPTSWGSPLSAGRPRRAHQASYCRRGAVGAQRTRAARLWRRRRPGRRGRGSPRCGPDRRAVGQHEVAEDAGRHHQSAPCLVLPVKPSSAMFSPLSRQLPAGLRARLFSGSCTSRSTRSRCLETVERTIQLVSQGGPRLLRSCATGLAGVALLCRPWISATICALHKNAQAGIISNRCRIFVQLAEAAP